MNNKSTCSDRPPGPLDRYRQHSFDWRKFTLLFESEECLRFHVSRPQSSMFIFRPFFHCLMTDPDILFYCSERLTNSWKKICCSTIHRTNRPGTNNENWLYNVRMKQFDIEFHRTFSVSHRTQPEPVISQMILAFYPNSRIRSSLCSIMFTGVLRSMGSGGKR